ncbi:MAG TPA: class II aldolase/adducin family protein [Bacteroidetes bacterium]|nr:class II aldolase/adducin family protein [Bacteroidota bacterium]
MSVYAGTGEWELKKMIIEIGRRIWTRGYVAANDGNITVKINDKEILTTPTGISKGFMTQDMILKMTLDGDLITKSPKYKPSSEVKMHLEVYRQREDIGSVIHAHPPHCTGFAVAGIPLDQCVLPEAILTIGAVPIARYGTPSTREIPDSIKPFVQNSDAILLENHGALTFGADLVSAYHRMETLEHAAQIVFLAIQLGNVNLIPRDQVDKLMFLRDKYGMTGRVTACVTRPPQPAKEEPSRDVVEQITKKVMDRLKN